MRRAQKMTPQERQQMILSMVAGLAERLKDEGGGLSEWMKLVNAYAVLGKRGEAKKAIALARENLHKDKQALTRLGQLAQRLGLGS